ncbi:FecCD family ABC transporter permease [Enterococcus camelliae]|uniref:FecCD family ABC transporter permease n=1 Tax=Enterococcus camelliae TaxID=453959 RepID=A0ABW5TLX3_9ENTE
MTVQWSKRSRQSIVIFASLILVIAILLSAGVALASGQAEIHLSEVYRILLYKVSRGTIGNLEGITQANANIVWFVRTPRILLSIFVGMGLAVSGAVMQAVVQNPLADPYILGISSGSSLGATFAILVGFGGSSFFFQFGLALGAFVGAVVATFLVLLLSSIGGRMTSTKLVLSGTIISSLCGSLANLIVYLANNAEGMKTVTFWSMGSLASANWTKLPLVMTLVIGLTLFFLLQYRVLNTMLLGDEVAVTLGIKLALYRRVYMILSALLTSIIVANSGMIGFVGLIIPHIVRGLTGSDHRALMLLTALSGGLFLIWADIIARSILKGVELPIGIITAIIGAPIFIYIIVKRQYNFGG